MTTHINTAIPIRAARTSVTTITVIAIPAFAAPERP